LELLDSNSDHRYDTGFATGKRRPKGAQTCTGDSLRGRAGCHSRHYQKITTYILTLSEKRLKKSRRLSASGNCVEKMSGSFTDPTFTVVGTPLMPFYDLSCGPVLPNLQRPS
jgi:hypothetical protein